MAMSVDEAHEEEYLKIAALVGSCIAACCLEARQELIPGAVEAETNTAFSWAEKAGMPALARPLTLSG